MSQGKMSQGKGLVYGKLSFYDSHPENTFIKIVADTANKFMGLQMVRKIMDMFGISVREIVLDKRKRNVEERGLFNRNKKQVNL